MSTLSAGDPGEVFTALSDPTRRQVVQRLSASGPATVTELASSLPVTRQAVAKHLATLSAAGLIASERDGRETRYRLTPAPLADASAWMADVGAQWDARLGRLSDLLGQRPPRRRPIGFSP